MTVISGLVETAVITIVTPLLSHKTKGAPVGSPSGGTRTTRRRGITILIKTHPPMAEFMMQANHDVHEKTIFIVGGGAGVGG